MEFSELQKFESYSSFKTRCVKKLSKGDLTVEQLLKHLEDGETEDYLQKLNVLWDTENILKRATEALTDVERKDHDVITSAVRLLLYIFSRQTKPVPGCPSPDLIIQNLQRLISSSKTSGPLETRLLAGSAIAALTVLTSKSDEDCLHTFSSYLKDSNHQQDSDLLRICLLNGMLTSVKSIVLMGENKDSDQNFLFTILEHVQELCHRTSCYEFHCFLLLRQWCSKFLEISNEVKIQSENNFKVEASAEQLENVMDTCRNNFENPTKGVSDLCYESYKDVLKIADVSLNPEDLHLFKEQTTEHVKGLKWCQKSKYIQLKALLNVHGPEIVMDDSSDTLALGLSTCLTSPHLVHAGTELYSLIIKNIDLKTWEATFGKTLISCLLDENDGVRMACLDQWLPATIRNVEHSANFIFKEIMLLGTEPALVAKVSILKICKKLEIQIDCDDIDELLDGCLQHSSQTVRCAAFNVICNAKKKGSVPTMKELELVKKFLSQNGSDGSSKFRQNVESSFSILCSRCRDYCSMMFRNKMKHKDPGLLESVIEFLDDCLNILISNLLQGGNYQRKIFNLDLLVVMNGCFFNFQSGFGSNKKSGNGDPTDFIKYAQQNDKMNLFQKRNFDIIALNLDDHMSDVKEKTVQVLELFTPSPAAYEELFSKMSKLINSPKESSCETGSVIAKLLTLWYKPDTEQSISNGLLDQLQSTFAKCAEDFLECSRHSAMYGIIMAIRRCLFDTNSRDRMTFDQKMIKKMIEELERVSELMLTILCGGGPSSSSNPDFQEMARAINNIVGDITETTDDDQISIPEDHQLVLSASWHNLKECILLAGAIVHNLKLEIDPIEDSCTSLSLSDTKRCCNLLKNIITRCRHKGVIEASNIASGLMASALLSSNIPDFQEMPRNILTDLFQQLESSWSKSSYTRRGAGVPGMIQKFVGSHSGGKNHNLLSFAVQRLLEIASVKDDHGTEAEDSPVSHSIHILKCLVQDANIARDISPHITEIASVCLDTFSSNSWSVRNAGLQLFGGMAPRIVGQKKIKDDNEGYNNVNVMEIEARFPGLISLLVSKLNSSYSSETCLLEPSIVPILTLLARMESNSINCSITDSVTECVDNFTDNPVMVVRKLGAKILSQFVLIDPCEVAADILEKLSNQDQEPYETNQQHSDLLVLLETVQRRNISLEEATSLSKILSEVDKILSCYVLKSEVLKILSKLPSNEEYSIFSTPTYLFEPGFYHWKQLVRKSKFELEEETDIEDKVDRVIKSAEKVEESITLLEEILSEDNSTKFKSHLTEKIVDYLLSEGVVERLNPEQNNQLFNSEVALELLDILYDEKLQSFGVTVYAKVINLRSVCLNIMLTQEDWEWFFGDTSEYVSKVVENSEDILKLSSPENIETCRILAGNSIKAYLETFKQKTIIKMPLVLQFGFVNLLNACLVLLEDEDVEVRDIATHFANRLPRPEFATSRHLDLNRQEAVQQVVWCGLDQLVEVVDMLTPVIEAIILPSQLSPDVLNLQQTEPCSLFRRGEGLNVYAETFYPVVTYYKAIRKYFQHQSYKVQIKINPETVLSTGKYFVEMIEQEDNIFSCSRSKRGLDLISRFQAMLALAIQLNIVQDEANVTKFQILLDKLNTLSLWTTSSV